MPTTRKPFRFIENEYTGSSRVLTLTVTFVHMLNLLKVPF